MHSLNLEPKPQTSSNAKGGQSVVLETFHMSERRGSDSDNLFTLPSTKTMLGGGSKVCFFFSSDINDTFATYFQTIV